MNAMMVVMLLFGADAFEAEFEKGVQAYSRGDYAGAVNAWEKLEKSAVADPAVFYNLGNAWYMRGRRGLAIAYYERALRLDPAFEYARDNLNKALRETERNLPAPLPSGWEQHLLFWHYDWPLRRSVFFAAGCWILFWGLLAVWQWKKLWRAGVLSAVLLIGAAVFTASAFAKTRPAEMAVTAVAAAPVRYGPSESDTVRFELFEGDRVAIETRKNGWIRVRTAGNERGWAKADALFPIGPPWTPPVLADTTEHHDAGDKR
jgi:tetratricopeptide (TPR) repeat protein